MSIAVIAEALPFIDLQAQRQRMSAGIDQAIARVLDHGRFILGPEVDELEHRLGEFCGAKHCITCANGTDALTLVLRAKGIAAGDAVIVPAFTFAATAEAVVLTGATPVFADVDTRTFNLDPQSVVAAIASARQAGLNPKALIAVDLFGQPADYENIRQSIASDGLYIIADAAQSFGARRRGRAVGTLADATTTSFYPSKPLGCYGDGGAVFTDDGRLAGAVRDLRNHRAIRSERGGMTVGMNSRIDTLQAAVLLEKLRWFNDEIEQRQHVARRYTERLRRHVQCPVIAAGTSSVWGQYTIVVEHARDALAEACAAAGVPTAVHYREPLHLIAGFRDFPRAAKSLAVSEQLARQVISLPMHAYLDETTQDRIINVIERALMSVALVPGDVANA